jgi:5-methylthioadenosine/S-adenosylhomocysteine deaminase
VQAMLFKNITILNEHMKIQKDMYVAIKGELISYIGDKPPKESFGDEIDGKNRLLMPGFFNCHAHSPMTLLRGYGENLNLQDWLTKKIFPFESKLDGDKVYWGMMLAIAESIRYGIVSTTDMYYFCDDMARAVLQTGVKNNIGRGITNFTGGDLWSLDAGKESKELFEQFNGTGNDKIRIDMSLHAEYTSDERTVRQLAEYASEVGCNIHVHVSETYLEHEECKQRHEGRTPSEYFRDCGLFDRPATAAHCVWLENQDFEILKEKGVTVACNPISNIKLASGTCNVPKLFDMGINVALGTDGVASNNSLNFMEDMKFFALLPKGFHQRLTSVSPEDVLRVATSNGALSQGRTDTGILKTGYKADLIMLDIGGPSMHPMHDLVSNIVLAASGSDVIMTMVDGKVLYKQGEFLTLDIEKVIYQADKSVQEILTALG